MKQATDHRGTNHHSAKLDEQLVRDIRRYYWVYGLCLGCVKKIVGIDINNSSLWDVANYVSWKHVKDNFTSNEITRVTRSEYKETKRLGPAGRRPN